MKIDLNLISERLRQARDALSYSLDEIYASAGIAVDRLSAIESGKVEPTGDEILILASLYNCDFRAFLDPGLPPPAEKTDILFRKYGDSFNAEDRRSVQEFLFFCRIEEELERHFGNISIDLPEVVTGTYYKGDGEKAAEELREKLELTNIPADVYQGFRRLGIHIFRRKLNNNEISGLYINDRNAGHCVLVNYQDDLYRQRFSLCHEVAHAIFDSSDDLMVTYEYKSTKYNKQDLREIRANSFASNYLMPVNILKSLPEIDEKNAAEWAGKLMVSTSALAKALKDAGIIDEVGASKVRSVKVPFDKKNDPELLGNISQREKSIREKILDMGLSDYYVNLCFKALEKNLISVGRLCEMLHIHHSELGSFCSLIGITVKHDV